MLRFCDGFDSYLTTADLAQKWNDYIPDYEFRSQPSFGAWEFNTTEGVNGGGCIKHVGIAGDVIAKEYARPGYGSRPRDLLWFKIATPPAAQLPFLRYNFSGNILSSDLEIDTSGFIVQRKFNSVIGTPGDVIYTGSINVCDNQWHCLERYILFKAALTGSPLPHLYIALDGVDLVDVDVITEHNNQSQTRFNIVSLGVDTWIDDVILWDDAGNNPQPYENLPDPIDTSADEFDWDWYNTTTVHSDINNFPERGQNDLYGKLGMKQITTLRPDANGAINTFDRAGAASNYEAVNAVAVDLAKYVSSNVIGNRELFSLEPFPHALPVDMVVMNYQMMPEDHGSIVIQPEAFTSPDFILGGRRRLVGKWVNEELAVNLVPNGGPTFVDTTGWTVFSGNGALSVIAGRLRFESTVQAVPGPIYKHPLTLDTDKFYVIELQVPAGNATRSFGVKISFDSSPFTVAGTTITPNATLVQKFSSAPFYVPADVSTVDLRVDTSHLVGFNDIDYVHVYEIEQKFVHKLYQLSLNRDPVTQGEWDQAKINAAQFGIRISAQ